MSSLQAIKPLPYDSTFEQIPEDEAETTRELIETLRTILDTTSHDYGHAVRSVHAKSHGLLQGELHVIAGLPAELAQGLFATPGNYPVVLRLSTNPGDLLADSVSTPRGLAIKVIGAKGPACEGANPTRHETSSCRMPRHLPRRRRNSF